MERFIDQSEFRIMSLPDHRIFPSSSSDVSVGNEVTLSGSTKYSQVLLEVWKQKFVNTHDRVFMEYPVHLYSEYMASLLVRLLLTMSCAAKWSVHCRASKNVIRQRLMPHELGTVSNADFSLGWWQSILISKPENCYDLRQLNDLQLIYNNMELKSW